MRRKYPGLVCAAILAMATTATASPIGLGVGIPIGSWELGNVYQQGVGTFTSMEAFIVSGNSTFEATGWGTLDGGWTSQVINPTYATASGSGVTQQWLSNKFTTAVGTMVAWDILTYNGSTLLERFQMWSDGTGWSVNNNTQYTASGGWVSLTTETGNYDKSVAGVPEPTTLTLLGVSLFGLGWRRRRSSRNL